MPTRDQRQRDASNAWKKAHPERHAELARAYRARNKQKTRAQNLLNYAVRTGRIRRLPCEKCGTTERVHAHHEDYRKPYKVHWLCFLCHKATHPQSDDDKRVKFTEAKRGDFKGENQSNSKITDEQVRQIRVLLRERISQERIGELFGIAQTTVSKIKLGKAWAHVK